jgi:hypothetical protein
MPQNKPKPWGDAFAIIGSGDNAKWVELGPVWKNKDGSFSVNLEVEPVAWGSPRCERRMQFRQRGQRNRNQNAQDDDE